MSKSGVNDGRSSRRGIVLLSTLISLTLIVTLVMLSQTTAIANLKSIKRLHTEERHDLVQDAVNVLARPLVMEAMLHTDQPPPLPLNSTPYTVKLGDHSVAIAVQDVDGLLDIFRTPDEVLRQMLPPDLARTILRIKEEEMLGLPLRQRFAAAGGDVQTYPEIGTWVTYQSTALGLNARNLPAHYRVKELGDRVPSGSYQSRTVIFRSSVIAEQNDSISGNP